MNAKTFAALPCCLFSLATAALAASASISPTGDTFVDSAQPDGNFGAAGGLAVSAPGSAKGELDTFMKFDLSSVVAGFNTQFQAGFWTVQSVTLTLYTHPTDGNGPLNDIFNVNSAGQFSIGWLQNDTWVEGSVGRPSNPDTDPSTLNYTNHLSYLSSGDQSLGSFAFTNSSPSTDAPATYTLTLAPSFVSDLMSGGAVSFYLKAADTSVSDLFYSTNKTSSSLKPILTVNVQGTILSGDVTLANKLAQYARDETLPGGTPKPISTLTASADDLTRAVYDLLANGPLPPGVTAVSLVKSALQSVNGKVRPDLNKIAARITNAAIIGGSTDDTQTIQGVLQAVLTINAGQSSKLQLTLAEKEAVTAVALADATTGGSSASSVGTAIAQTAFANVGGLPTDAAKQAFIAGTLKSISSSDVLPSFVAEGLNSFAGDKTIAAINIAATDAKNPAAVNAAIAGRVQGLISASDIETVATSAARNPKLSKVISDVVAGAGSVAVGVETAADYAAHVTASVANPKVDGSILSGALRAASSTTSSGNTTSDVVSAVFGNTITTANAAAIAAAAGVGTGGINVNGTTRAAELAALLAATPGATAKLQTAIGEAIIKDIAVTAPNAAGSVAAAIATAEQAGTDPIAASTLAGTLAKAAPTAAAAGSSTAGIAGLLPASAGGIAQAAIKAKSSAALNIAEDIVPVLPGTNAQKEDAAVNLAGSVSSSSVASVVAGLAVAFGGNQEADHLSYQSANVVSRVVSLSANQTQAVKIAAAASNAVDGEQVANIATSVAALLGTTSKLKLSAAPALAAALAKIIETKPGITWSNRGDELSELAASVVAGILGKSSLPTKTEAQNAAAEAKLIGSVGVAIIKAIGKKLYPNLERANGVPADLSDIVRDVAGSIAQTIAVAHPGAGAFTSSIQAMLLSSSGPLATALAKAAGTKFAADSSGAFSEVNSYFISGSNSRIVPGSKELGTKGVANQSLPTGKYEIGSVVENETPTKNI